MGEKGINHTMAFRGSGFIRNYMQDKAVYTMQKDNKGDVYVIPPPRSF